MPRNNHPTDLGPKVGMLGGTFDPPHLGHLIVADQAIRNFGLSSVVFVVANEPWQKTGTADITPFDVRLEMTDLAVRSCSNNKVMFVSDIERQIGGPSYTTNTLTELKLRHPQTEWFSIVGADTAHQLETWHQPERLAQQTKFIIASRPGSDTDFSKSWVCDWNFELLNIPEIGISASDIRRRVSVGESINFLTPAKVVSYVQGKRLYSA